MNMCVYTIKKNVHVHDQDCNFGLRADGLMLHGVGVKHMHERCERMVAAQKGKQQKLRNRGRHGYAFPWLALLMLLQG
jgi:hypothetical protein